MAAPDPYQGTDEEFDPAIHWGAVPGPIGTRTFTGESIAGSDPSGENMFSRDRGEASIVGIIDATRERGFLRWCLGWNNTNSGEATYKLLRTLPICHPRFTNLICTGVATRGLYPVRRTGRPAGSTNSGLKLPKNTAEFGIVASANSGGEARTFPYYAGYEKALATIRFSPVPYRLRDDSYVIRAAGSGEYVRNTMIDMEPRTETLTLSGFTIKYAEGEANTGPVSNPKGQAFPAEIGQVLIKPDLKFTWYDVPEKFIFTTDLTGTNKFPAKILKGCGTLNQFEWIGYPRGTLILSAVRFVRTPWTLAAPIASGTNNESEFNYHVEFLFNYFNPTKGYTSDVQIVDGNTFGHNCFPFRGVDDATPDKNAGRWFFATYNGTLTTGYRGLYEYSSYSNLFDDVRNPDITSW